MALNGGERSSVERIMVDSSSVIAKAITQQRRAFGSVRHPAATRRDADIDPLLGEFRGAMVVPLASGARVLGALVALDRDEGFDPFDDDDLRLFEALAAHASTTMERAQLVEELRLEAESKWHQATHDALTGLPNRTLFLERASEALAETGRAAVALLDLDRFKEVNDTLGHSTGDRLALRGGGGLVRASSGRATVARLGGDEFVLVVPDIIGPEEALGIVRDLLAAISKPMDIDGITLAVTAAAGVSLAPEHGDNVATLLQTGRHRHVPRQGEAIGHRAVLAQPRSEHAAQAGPRRPSRRGSRERAAVERDVPADRRPGLRRSRPRRSASRAGSTPSTGRFRRTSSLPSPSRWDLSGRSPTSCSTRPAARRHSGTATDSKSAWRSISSGRDLSDRSLVRKVTEHLGTHGLPPSALTLEITETEVMADIGEASGVLGQLGDLGVRIAVDDYGTGYSSLAYLHRLPVNELKLDRSFVANVAADQSNSIIVRSSIAMAHSLGLTVVAEGAEDEVTCAILADAGCDAVQGYYFSPPLGRDDLLKWFATHPRLRFSHEIPSSRPLRVISGRSEEALPASGESSSQVRG